MRCTIFASVAAAAVFIGQPSVRANEAPWCAVVSRGDDVHWDCQYRSIEECRGYVVSGNRGWCNPNPYFNASSRRTKLRLRD